MQNDAGSKTSDCTIRSTPACVITRKKIDLNGPCLLGLACVSSLLLMWPMASAGPLALDEHGSYWIIDSDLPSSLLSRSLDYAAVPPLSGWLQQVFLMLFGKSELVFRLPSALCHLAAVFVIYKVGTDIRDRNLGGIAALILAWHPEALDEVRIARCYGLVLLLSALVLLATGRWLKSPRPRGLIVFWGLAAAGLIWTHYTAALLVVITAAWLGVWSLRRGRRRGDFSRWLMCMIALAVVCLPLIPALLRLREWGPHLNYMTDDQRLWDFVGPFWWFGFPVGMLMSWLIGRKPVEPNHDLRRQMPLLIGCSLAPLLTLAVLASGDFSSLANPRYRVAYAPAGACLMALVIRCVGSGPAVLWGVVTAVAAAWTLAPLNPFELGRLGNPVDTEWHDVGTLLKRISGPDEVVFVQSGLVEGKLVGAYVHDRLFMEYVACRVGRFYLDSRHPRYALPFLWDEDTGVQSFYQNLLLHMDDGDTFWIAAATDTDLNRNSLAHMQHVAGTAEFTRTEEYVWQNVRLEHYIRKIGERP